MAGFFDGEGCVNLTVSGRSRQVCLRLMIVNTDHEILSEIHLSFGGRLARPRGNRKGWKSFRQIVFSGKEAYEFLLSVYPFLVVKKRQAKLAIDFWNFQHRPSSERCEIYKNPNCPIGYGRRRTQATIETELLFKKQMHELNRKGPGVN